MFMSYASNPLVLGTVQGDDSVVRHHTMLSLGGAYAFGGRFEAGAHMPLYLQSGQDLQPGMFGVPPASGAARGDLTLHGKARLAGNQAFGAGVALSVTLPTATDSQFTGTDLPTVRALILGETAVGIVFIHDAVVFAVQGDPIKPVAPCEGTGYEIGSMSIVKGARNLENAKKFYDWALTPAAQALAAPAKSYQVPSNKASPVPAQSPKMDQMKLINYDFVKYGSSAERTRLLAKWDKEVKALPK